jgi:hypothetical protein
MLRVLVKAGYANIAEIPPKEEWELSQDRLTSYQNLLEDVGFHGNIDTLYSFLEQWNKIILEMKRCLKWKPTNRNQCCVNTKFRIPQKESGHSGRTGEYLFWLRTGTNSG